MAAGTAWFALGVAAVRYERRRSRPVSDRSLLELVNVLCAEMACRRPIEVRESDDLATAATIGWRRPLLLLPSDWTSWTADQRLAVLAHEIAHARGHDFPALLCGQLGLMLHFYNPLLHWLMNRLRLEQELAADAAAAGVSGGQWKYLTTIAELALHRQERPLSWPARTFLPTQTTFLRRIAVLRNSKLRFHRISTATRATTVGCVLLCGLLVAGLRGPGQSASAAGDSDDKGGSSAPARQDVNELQKMPFTIGVKFFRDGDSITINEVRASTSDLKNGDKVIVKGRYTLVSEPEASLCLFATATTGSGKSPIRAGQTMHVAKGSGDFELYETLDCDGYLHVTFYSIAKGEPFGGLYFGTAKQMETIKDWNLNHYKTPAERPKSGATNATDAIVEGIGWNAVRIGATREELVKALGKADDDSTPDWMKWKDSHHIECTFHGGDKAAEVRFDPGFEKALANGLKLGSPGGEVLKLYGEPDHVIEQSNGAKEYEYSQKGILFWTYQGKITQIVVFKPYVFSTGAGQSVSKDVSPVHGFIGEQTKAAEPPRVIATSPSAGNVDVDPATSEITVTFDRDMGKGFSWTGGGPFYPAMLEGKRPFSRDSRTCVLPVKLQRGHYYRVGIQSTSFRNFRSVEGTPADPSAIYFTTQGADAEQKSHVCKPRIVALTPPNGAKDVSPTLQEIRVTFDMPMGKGCSWTGGGDDFPQLPEGQTFHWTEDRKTCVLPVELKPGVEYHLGINSPSFNNFQSEFGVPLDFVTYTFTTSR